MLLERAILKGSTDCLLYLSTTGIGPLDYRDINERNLLHKLCIRQRANPISVSEDTLEKLLELAPELPTQADFTGRRPLHYAAEFDFVSLARILLNHAISCGYYDDKGFSDASWEDREGHTPLFLAVLHGNYLTLKELIEIGHVIDIDHVISVTSARQRRNSSDAISLEFIPDYILHPHRTSVAAMACKVSSIGLLTLLIDKGASVDTVDENGETALLIAVRNRFLEGVRILINRGHADVNLAEKINGWTPLIVAAMEGSVDIVQLLLDGGADRTYKDNDGWRAYEHAIFRGHLEIGRLTKPDMLLEKQLPIDPPKREQIIKPDISDKALEARSNAARLYGHKYLTDQKMIIVKLGSNDIRNPLFKYFMRLSDASMEEQRLSILVSAEGATGELPIIDLPCKDERHMLDQEPIILYSSNPDDVILRFDLVETFGLSVDSNIIARATVTLAGDRIYTRSGGFKGQESGNSSLRGQKTVPVISAETLDCIGTIGLEYFVVTPFSHAKMTIGDRYTYYRSLDTKIIGHRGSGMNQKASRLQVGENTVLSFITAASLGAEYIEFDVQLTKDLVPVIYHDWTVSETGYDIPINAITVEQFLNLRPSGYIRDYHTGISEDSDARDTLAPLRGETEQSPSAYDTLEPPQARRIARSNSMSALQGARVHNFAAISRRLQFTHANKVGKLKGNGPESIQAPFTTLAEALKKIPSSAGLNIEVKYPMVDEAEGDELHQFQEINIFVDTILACVYDHAERDRRIIFSSFHPEICVALNHKQPNYPVFFLTDAGTLPMADVRCNSLHGAVRFAKQADLLGIVAASEPILEAPRMVNIIKESGLLLFTYGVLNNVVENAVAQRNYGVDAVIVDSVVAVRKGLRGDTAADKSII
ncbi:Glycerophosphoryl diester phosphodiesterase family-domain-containing protein [Dichotomocladium elegans]|nr:Glycerophosphoryl diester phosphodiesterase family-domain-containing protein [Dichotomocladium elegans]